MFVCMIIHLAISIAKKQKMLVVGPASDVVASQVMSICHCPGTPVGTIGDF